MGVAEVERRTAVAERRNGLELDGVRIGRAGRQFPPAPWSNRIDHRFACEVADAARRPLPPAVVDVELAAGAKIKRTYRDPGDSALRESSREFVPASAVGHPNPERRAASASCRPRASHVEIQHVAQPIPREPPLLNAPAPTLRV